MSEKLEDLPNSAQQAINVLLDRINNGDLNDHFKATQVFANWVMLEPIGLLHICKPEQVARLASQRKPFNHFTGDVCPDYTDENQEFKQVKCLNCDKVAPEAVAAYFSMQKLLGTVKFTKKEE